MYLGLASQGRRGPARMSGAGVDTACTTCPACLPQGPVRDVAAVTVPRLAAGTRQGRRLGSLSVFGHTVTAGHRLQDMRTLVSPAGGSGRCHPSCKEKQRSGTELRFRHPTLSPGLGLLPFLSPALSPLAPFRPLLPSCPPPAPSHFCPLSLSLLLVLMPLFTHGVNQTSILSFIHSSTCLLLIEILSLLCNINKSVPEQILGMPAGLRAWCPHQ